MGKMTFHHIWPSGKNFGGPCKKPLLTPLEKIFLAIPG